MTTAETTITVHSLISVDLKVCYDDSGKRFELVSLPDRGFSLGDIQAIAKQATAWFQEKKELGA